MSNTLVNLLLIGEISSGSSLIARLEALDCHYTLARSCEDACAKILTRKFALVLSPLQLHGKNLLPLTDLLRGTETTLFYFQAVEESCWWLPALRQGQRCFGSNALRPSDFGATLENIVRELLNPRPANSPSTPQLAPAAVQRRVKKLGAA